MVVALKCLFLLRALRKEVLTRLQLYSINSFLPLVLLGYCIICNFLSTITEIISYLSIHVIIASFPPHFCYPPHFWRLFQFCITFKSDLNAFDQYVPVVYVTKIKKYLLCSKLSIILNYSSLNIRYQTVNHAFQLQFGSHAGTARKIVSTCFKLKIWNNLTSCFISYWNLEKTLQHQTVISYILEIHLELAKNSAECWKTELLKTEKLGKKLLNIKNNHKDSLMNLGQKSVSPSKKQTKKLIIIIN